MALWIASFRDGERFQYGGVRQRYCLQASKMLCERLDRAAGTRIHDRVLASFHSWRDFNRLDGSYTRHNKLCGLVKIGAGSLGDGDEWKTVLSEELLLQKAYHDHEANSYSLRILNTRAALRPQQIPALIGRNFNNASRKERHFNLATSVRLLSWDRMQFLGICNWAGEAGNVPMADAGREVDFSWSYMAAAGVSCDGDQEVFPELEDDCDSPRSQVQAMSNDLASDVLHEWGLGEYFSIDSEHVSTPSLSLLAPLSPLSSMGEIQAVFGDLRSMRYMGSRPM